MFAGLGLPWSWTPSRTSRGADEAFQVLRARLLATELGPPYRAHPEAFKETLRWNIERGFALSAEDVARGERLTAEVAARAAAFMADVDVLVLPTVQVLPFPVETEYPTVVAGEPMDTYVDWMRSCSWISVTGLPAVSVPARVQRDGLPVGCSSSGAPVATTRCCRWRTPSSRRPGSASAARPWPRADVSGRTGPSCSPCPPGSGGPGR